MAVIDPAILQFSMYSVAGFPIGLVLMYRGVKSYLLAQRIRNTPTSTAEGAAVGLIELKGKAACKGSITSPITKQKCAYWKIVCEYSVSSRGNNWNNLTSEDSASDLYDLPEDSDGRFYLDDGTGRILIDPADADIDIPCNNHFEGYLAEKDSFGIELHKIDDRVLAYIEQCDDSTKKKFMKIQKWGAPVRVFEYCLAEGDDLYVLGSAEPLDGSVSGAEYENLIVRKRKSDNIMYIRDTGEKMILGKLGYFTYVHIFGGLALSAVCLFIILVFIGIL